MSDAPDNGNGQRRKADTDRIERAVENKWAKGVLVYILPPMVAVIGWLIVETFTDVKALVKQNTAINVEQTVALTKVNGKLEVHEQRLTSFEEWLKSLSRARRADDRER